jgi:Ycf4
MLNCFLLKEKMNLVTNTSNTDQPLAGSGQLKTKSENAAKNLIRRYIIVGERRFSNYWWATVIFLGACGFLYTGISAYLGKPLLSFLAGDALNQTNFDISFFPQGLLMSFYGSLGLLLSFYWMLLIFWNVGGGFNELNKKEGIVRIFRWGYPGKNRKIDLIYSLKDVEAIRVELKQGLDPQRTIFLRLKATSTNNQAKTINFKREIPLTGISQPLTLKEIEKQASELANFLQVSLEGL